MKHPRTSHHSHHRSRPSRTYPDNSLPTSEGTTNNKPAIIPPENHSSVEAPKERRGEGERRRAYLLKQYNHCRVTVPVSQLFSALHCICTTSTRLFACLVSFLFVLLTPLLRLGRFLVFPRGNFIGKATIAAGNDRKTLCMHAR